MCRRCQYYNFMGGQDSKPKEEDIFLLEHISKMTLNSRRTVSYYFIHPQKEAGDDLMKQLSTYFKIDHFKSIKTLKQEMSFVNKLEIVKIIAPSSLPKEDLDYLIAESKIYQIIFYGPNSNSQQLNGKIVATAEEAADLVKKLNEKQGKDTLTIASHNLLLVDKDTKLLNKYRLNYHCNTTFAGNEQALEDFTALAFHLFPEQKHLIQQFAATYRSSIQPQDKNKFIMEWAFKNSFYWQLVSEITRNTTDPKKLAYVRLALRDLFLTIKSQFKEKKSYKEVFIVIDVNEEELAKLEKSQGKFILFTSFVKAYSNEKEANAQLKLRPQAFKFTVLPNRSKLEPTLDFGFIINEGQQPNVIFNIYNVFGISEVNTKTRRGQILYGALAKGYLTRQDENRPKMTREELDLMRNYDYLEDMMAKVDSQATVLQLSGYYKESLQIYDKKVDFIRKTTESQQSMDKCMIKKADALRISGDYQNAEKQYQSVTTRSQKMKLISLVHIAQLYLMKGETQKFDKVIDQLAPKVQELRHQEKDEYFKACNYIVIRTIKKGSFKSAQKMLNELQTKVTQQYPNNLEGKPIVHDIYRSIATCSSKLGRHSEALGLLKNTLSWQLVCEGKTANVALTETLIQTVSRSSGNNEELEQSIARMSSLSEEIQSSEGRMESAIGIDLNKSLINISI